METMQYLQTVLTCSKINNNINEEDGVWEAVKDDPSCGQVVIEKGDGHRKYDEIGH